MQALTIILHHHAPEWETAKEMRKNDLGLPTEITNGINVTEWHQKEKEDRNKLSDSSQIFNSEQEKKDGILLACVKFSIYILHNNKTESLWKF